MMNKIAAAVCTGGMADQLKVILTSVVELSATYLIHSTLSLVTVWLLLDYLPTRFSRTHFMYPAMMDAGWKLATILPIGTSVLCLTVDISPSFLRWSCTVPQMRTQESKDLSQNSNRSPLQQVRSNAALVESSIDQFPEQATEWSSAGDLRIQQSSSARPHSTVRANQLASNTGRSVEVAEPPLSLADTLIVSSLPKLIRPNSDRAGSSGLVVWIGAAILLWIAITLLRLARLRRALSSLLRQCIVLPTIDRCDLRQLAPLGFRIKFLRLMRRADSVWNDVASSVPQPFACGIIHPSVVVPQEIEEILTLQELRALLSHEVAHLVRRDPIWQWIGEVVCTCLVFQPLNRLARRRWQCATEMLCDDWAVDHRVSPTLLATCLTKVAEWRLDQVDRSSLRSSLILPAIGPRGSLTSRMNWLLRSRQNVPVSYRISGKIGRTALVATGLLIGATGPRLDIDLSAHEARLRDHDVVMEHDRGALENELKAAIEEFHQLKLQLDRLDDPEVWAAANSVVQQFSKITTRSVTTE